MVKSKRMHRIALLSETAERVAAQALSVSRSEMERCHQQLSELKGYRQEYSQALTSGTGAQLNGYQANELRLFISRVDATIDALENKFAQSKQRQDRDRETWAGHLRRTKALHHVAGRESNNETRRAEAVSQQELDDRAAAKTD